MEDVLVPARRVDHLFPRFNGDIVQAERRESTGDRCRTLDEVARLGIVAVMELACGCFRRT